MGVILSFSLKVQSSGTRQCIGFSFDNGVQLLNGYCFQNKVFFGLKMLKGSLDPRHIDKGSVITNMIDCRFELEHWVENEQIITLIKNLEHLTTFFISKYEENPQDGLIYVEADLASIRLYDDNNLCNPNALIMSGHQTMISLLKLDLEQWYRDCTDTTKQIVFYNYYAGIRANYPQSKYFHWFLILETIEKSEYYRREFTEHLFTSSELKSLAERFKTDSRKYNAIMSLKNYTLKSRREKLYLILRKLGIVTYHCIGRDYELTENTVEKIITYRNQLFHQSKVFDEWFMWQHLFPIVRAIIKLMLDNPNILEIY